METNKMMEMMVQIKNAYELYSEQFENSFFEEESVPTDLEKIHKNVLKLLKESPQDKNIQFLNSVILGLFKMADGF